MILNLIGSSVDKVLDIVDDVVEGPERDPSWQLRHALGHNVEPNPKSLRR